MAIFRRFSIRGPWAPNASSIITNAMPLPPSIYPVERVILALGKILMYVDEIDTFREKDTFCLNESVILRYV